MTKFIIIIPNVINAVNIISAPMGKTDIELHIRIAVWDAMTNDPAIAQLYRRIRIFRTLDAWFMIQYKYTN